MDSRIILACPLFIDIIVINLSFLSVFAIRFDGDFINNFQTANFFKIYL